MAEQIHAKAMSNHDSPTVLNGQPRKGASHSGPRQKTALHQIYALPAPVRTFPLPAFYPNNPLSIFHVAYVWISQVLRPPAAEPSVIHQGIWSDVTTSIHVTEAKSIRALWEQGFYGKGNLSRSEANWLKREQVRRGLEKAHVSELVTVERREERARAKWERARLEQEAIRQTRLKEAESKQVKTVPSVPLQASRPKVLKEVFGPPVSPLQLLALPNSSADALRCSEETSIVDSVPVVDLGASHTELPPKRPRSFAPVGPLELLSLPNSSADTLASEDVPNKQVSTPISAVKHTSQDSLVGHVTMENSSTGAKDELSSNKSNVLVNGESKTSISTSLLREAETGAEPSSPLLAAAALHQDPATRRKSVRFSPPNGPADSQSTLQPLHSHFETLAAAPTSSETAHGSGVSHGKEDASLRNGNLNGNLSADHVEDKEHLQLMPEEAFFLRFGLGVLEVLDPWSGLPLSTADLLRLFRQSSYFPPLQGLTAPELRPDDGFLVNYVVYHHFRSLGWVPRAGIKFGVDWLLYARGPVFDHAEFGLMIIPSYTHPLWAGSTQQSQRKTWAWFHSVLRVLSHVMKSLVLVYVDIPPAQVFDAKMEQGLVQVFESYQIREVVVKRWSSNRNR